MKTIVIEISCDLPEIPHRAEDAYKIAGAFETACADACDEIAAFGVDPDSVRANYLPGRRPA